MPNNPYVVGSELFGDVLPPSGTRRQPSQIRGGSGSVPNTGGRRSTQLFGPNGALGNAYTPGQVGIQGQISPDTPDFVIYGPGGQPIGGNIGGLNANNPEYQRQRAAEQAAQGQQRQQFYDAFEADRVAQQGAIDRANADRRGAAGELNSLLGGRLNEARASGNDLVATGDRDADLLDRNARNLDREAGRVRGRVLGDLDQRNRQGQEEAVGGLLADFESQARTLEADPLLSPAQKLQAKQRLRQDTNSRASAYIGQLATAFEGLRAQASVASEQIASGLRGQASSVRDRAASLRQQSRISREVNTAAAASAAANGLTFTSQLLSQPDQVFSQFDSLVNFSLVREGLPLFGGETAAQRQASQDQASGRNRNIRETPRNRNNTVR